MRAYPVKLLQSTALPTELKPVGIPTISIYLGFFKLFCVLYIFRRGCYIKTSFYYIYMTDRSSFLRARSAATTPSVDHWLVFSYDSNESIPIILGYGHELKPENIVKCTSKLSCKTDTFFVIKKTMTFKNNNIEIYLTFSLRTPKDGDGDGDENEKRPYYDFSRGFIYIDKKSFNIKYYAQYNSLQIGECCYDNIGVVKLDYNIFSQDD